jgi:hypothetical protein
MDIGWRRYSTRCCGRIWAKDVREQGDEEDTSAFEKLTEDLKKVYREELHDLHSSPNIIRVTQSRRMRWAGHVARIGKRCIQGTDEET